MNDNPNLKSSFNWATIKNVGFLVLLVVSHYFILKNVLLLSEDMLYGNYAAEKVVPAPQYPFLRVWDVPPVRQYDAYNRLAGDFAQIYFPAKSLDLLAQNYISGAHDFKLRPSRYAPMVHYLCAITYCTLQYGPASLVHMFLQLLLFYAFFAASFLVLNIKKYLGISLVLVNIYLFLTPAGLSWFERGQFSLYVAISYLLLILGLLRKNIPFIMLAAFFAFIKWTSFPYIFIVIVIFLLSSSTRKDLFKNAFLIAPFLLTIILLLMWSPRNGIYFIRGLFQQERFAIPDGISLAMLLPVTWVKFLPLLLICLGLLYISAYKNQLDKYIPYLIGTGIFILTYPTLAFEYSFANLFCFIPLIVYWAKLPNVAMSLQGRKILVFVFLLFLFLASNSKMLINFTGLKFIVFVEYLLITLAFVFIPLLSDRFALNQIVKNFQWNRHKELT